MEFQCFVRNCTSPAIVNCDAEEAELVLEAVETQEWGAECPRLYCSDHNSRYDIIELGRRRALKGVQEKIHCIEHGGTVTFPKR
jgi:hypothetical protein